MQTFVWTLAERLISRVWRKTEDMTFLKGVAFPICSTLKQRCVSQVFSEDNHDTFLFPASRNDALQNSSLKPERPVSSGSRIVQMNQMSPPPRWDRGIKIKMSPFSGLLRLSFHVCVCVQVLLKDPLYIGLRHKRVRGQAYDDLLDEFMKAVSER